MKVFKQSQGMWESRDDVVKIGWADIVGHLKVREALLTMLRENRLPHALLFVGAEGVGKKCVARALAASILCTGDGAPCGTCESCRQFAAGTNLNYLELAPETEGKAKPILRIDRVREAMTRIARKAAGSGGRRVLVMDDAEAMNEPAENSLLKTLEEPAGDVTFILITRARRALLPTILSRCIPISFPLLTADEVAQVLMQKGVEEESAHALAALSGGRVSMAEKLRAHGSLALEEHALSLIEGAPKLSMEHIFSEAEELSKWNREMLREYFGILQLLLRDVLVLRMDGAASLMSGAKRRETLVALLERYSEREIYAFLDLTKEAERRLATNAASRLLLESFLIRLRDVFLPC